MLHTAWPVAEANFVRHWQQQQNRTGSRPQIVEMPAPLDISTAWPSREESGTVESIAAAGAQVDLNRVVPLSNFQRLRSDWTMPAALADVSLSTDAAWQGAVGDLADEEDLPAFQRPQGSWRARGFGTVLHAFLEPLANILALNADSSAQERSIDALRPAIRSQLLSNGHPPQEAGTDAGRIVAALHSVAADQVGRWILSRHTAPSPLGTEILTNRGFEIPLTAMHRNVLRSIRVDRMFLAGGEPENSSADTLWIVDFKTASHGAAQLEEFLANEREQYAEQMQLYGDIARIVFPETRNLRLGLYYPLLTRLVWWPHESER